MINLEVLENINNIDMNNILEVWESSVRVTHNFLSEKDIIKIKPQVVEGVKYVNTFICVRDKDKIIQAFMGVNDNKIEMLFIRNEYRGKGIGKVLVNHGIKNLDVKYVDVNKDNIQALKFYKHMGFEVFKESELDDNKDPFPILSMKIK